MREPHHCWAILTPGTYPEGVSFNVSIPDELAARLAAEAARRGAGVDQTATDLLAAALDAKPKATGDRDALAAFIGSGDSGDPTWASRDIHELRSELAARRATSDS